MESMTDLRTLRKHLGWTQAELATTLGIRRSTISDHERGAAPVPRERMLAVLCLCLWAIMMMEARQQDDAHAKQPS